MLYLTERPQTTGGFKSTPTHTKSTVWVEQLTRAVNMAIHLVAMTVAACENAEFFHN